MAKKYEDEFKLMIVELLQSGQSVNSVSSEYNLNVSMIYNSVNLMKKTLVISPLLQYYQKARNVFDF